MTSLFELVIGSIGVGILLLAFVLNILRVFSERHPVYLLMNVVGSGLAAWYAWAEYNLPFIVLEIVWGGVALVRLVLILTKKDSRV